MEISDVEWKERLDKIRKILEMNAKNPEAVYYGFLDFDGVINVFLDPNTPEYQEIVMEKAKKFQFVDEKCMKRLSDFCLQHSIKIVISSSWRFSGVEYCKKYLLQGGMDERVPVVGTTEMEFSKNREIHITDYLLEHPDFKGFIIFDDLGLPHLSQYLVQCETLRGFDDIKAEEAKKLIAQF